MNNTAEFGHRSTHLSEKLVSVDHFNRARTHLCKSPRNYDTPRIINFTRIVCIVNAFK